MCVQDAAAKLQKEENDRLALAKKQAEAEQAAQAQKEAVSVFHCFVHEGMQHMNLC